MLTFTQPREQHDRPARKFERVSMPVRAIAYIAEPGQALAELLFRKKAIAPSYLTSASNASSVPGGRHTEMSGSPTAAKPRVIELGKCVETSLSPTLAGRAATLWRLVGASSIGSNDSPLRTLERALEVHAPMRVVP